jgi:hypothetical protein
VGAATTQITPLVKIKRDKNANRVAVPEVAPLDIADVKQRDAVRAAVLQALAAGKITPAAARAFTSLLANAAEDEARELEGQLDRALHVIADLRAQLDRR